MKLALIVLGLASAAAAEPVAIPNSKVQFEVPKPWARQADDPARVGTWQRGPSTLVLTRAQVPNLAAWIKTSRDAYLREVERGALAAIPGSKQLARAFAEVQGVPTLDLELRRPDGSQLVIRWLLFRTYVLALTIDVAKEGIRGGALDEARALARQLTAPPTRP